MSICAQKHYNCPTCTCTDPVDPALVDDLLFGESPEELNKTFKQEPDLRPYGFAEGNYFCKCRICGCDYEGDKRSRNCYNCDVKEYKNDETNSDNWDDAQWYESGWDDGNKRSRKSIEELVSFIEKGRFSFASTLKIQMDWYLESTDIINKYK